MITELTPEVEKQLAEEAVARGLASEQYARLLIEGGLLFSDARTTALLSESALRKIWDTPEEDAAWQNW